MAFLLILWIVCGFVGWKIGQSKGRGVLGAVLGFCLGLIGLLIVAVLGPAKPRDQVQMLGAPGQTATAVYTCRGCRQQVLPSATVCAHCGRPLRPTALPTPPPGTRAAWLRDPSTRFVDRYWDGFVWTEWVRNEPNSHDFRTDPPVPV